MSKSKLLCAVSLTFAIGIGIASYVLLPVLWLYGALGFCVAAAGMLYFSKKPMLAVVAFCVAFAVFGAVRLAWSEQENAFMSLVGQNGEWEGYIVEDVDVRTDKQLITFQPKGYDQRILITTSLYQQLHYGDWIVVKGKLQEPKNFSGFDYQGYLERYQVFAVMQYPKILVLRVGQGNAVMHALLSVKDVMVGQINKLYEGDERGLLLGILIGAKKALSAQATEYFALTGTSHIVALSGFNISIFVSAFGHLHWLFGRRRVFWFTVAVIFSFVIMTGAQASVVRAAIMGLLLLVGQNAGRQYSAVPAMLAAGFGMLLVNPRILYWDIGFQLSFAATLGIVYFVPLFERLTPHVPFKTLKGIVFATVAATVATLPLILLHFGRLSVVALAANILILPVIPVAMGLGALSLLPFFGPGFAFLTAYSLKYVLTVAQVLAELPVSSVEFHPPWWALWLIAAAVVGVYGVLKQWAERKFKPVSVTVDASKSLW